MKTIYIFMLLVVLALLFCLGSVGGYEAGKLSTPELLACCGGSAAVEWASLAAIDKIERRGGNNGNKSGAPSKKHIQG